MNELPNYIQNGMFGQNQPMGGGQYNPYAFQGFMPPPMSNMIPVGSYGYNQSAFQQPPQQPGYVFQPVGGGYNPNPYYQPRQDYYNPFPQFQQQQPYYSYGSYYNYSPFMSMQYQQQMMNMEIEKNKLKYRICAAALGREVDEEELDRLFNPYNKANVKTEAQIESDRMWDETVGFHKISMNPSQFQSPYVRLANFLKLKSENYHKALDEHSLCEFFEEDQPRLEREFWIEENIKKNAQRDMSTTYNSTAYNELLNLHRSSNPYINELMDHARYDNNIDDTELGLAELFDRERRRRNVLEGKLPTYISSPEVQKARAEYTQQLMDQIYRKEANRQNV